MIMVLSFGMLAHTGECHLLNNFTHKPWFTEHNNPPLDKPNLFNVSPWKQRGVVDKYLNCKLGIDWLVSCLVDICWMPSHISYCGFAVNPLCGTNQVSVCIYSPPLCWKLQDCSIYWIPETFTDFPCGPSTTIFLTSSSSSISSTATTTAWSI